MKPKDIDLSISFLLLDSCPALLVECDNGLVTNLEDWSAAANDVDFVPFEDEFEPVLETTSDVYLTGATTNPTKIWASNGLQYAWFQATPLRTTYFNFNHYFTNEIQ